MMRQNACVLISLAATILATSGCSPFRAKLNRHKTDSNLSQHVQPASYNSRTGQPPARSLQAGIPPAARSANLPAVDDKTQQWIALARLSERREQYDQAEKIFRQIIARVPNHPLPYHRMGIVRAKQSRFDEAEQYLSKAYELDPSNPTLLSDIGYFYYLTSDSARAEQFLRYALQFDPQHEAAHNNLAIVVGESGNLDEARQHFRRVGSEAEAEANMAFVHAQRGELSAAVDSYSRALTLDNSMKPAAYGLLNLARRQPRETGRSHGRDISQAPASTSQPAVIDVASPARPRPTPAAPYKPAEIITGQPVALEQGQPVALDRGVAVVNQPTGKRPGGLLTHLSDFANSLNVDNSNRQATATVTEDDRRPSSQAALAVLEDVRQVQPAASPAEAIDDDLSSASSDDNETWAPTDSCSTEEECSDVTSSRSVAPLGRLQQRLNRLRDDRDTSDSGDSTSKSPGVIVYQAPEFRPTVSLSISDKSAEGVEPASFSPAKDDTGDNKQTSTDDDPSDSLETQSPDDSSADASSDEEQGFMETWLTPEPPRESSRRQAQQSSRRGA